MNKKLLEIIIEEYLAIVETLLETHGVENNRIIIDRQYFRKLLERYHYLKFNQKTKIYKDLNFLIHDKNNYTMPCKDAELKKTIRKVVFNYETYLTVKNLTETVVNL